jgi:hypothetical protein
MGPGVATPLIFIKIVSGPSQLDGVSLPKTKTGQSKKADAAKAIKMLKSQFIVEV